MGGVERMRRPGNLRFPSLGPPWFIVSLNASGLRPVQKQVSICKAKLGLGLVTTTVRGSGMRH